MWAMVPSVRPINAKDFAIGQGIPRSEAQAAIAPVTFTGRRRPPRVSAVRAIVCSRSQ